MGYVKLSHVNKQVDLRKGSNEEKGNGDITVMTFQKSYLHSRTTSLLPKQESISFIETEIPDREFKNEQKGGTSLTRSSRVVLEQ